MLDRVWVIGLALAFSATAHAGGIYKCVSGEGIAYQSAPCTGGSEQVLALSTNAEPLSTARRDVDDSSPRGSPSRVTEWADRPSTGTPASWRDTLSLGATDDQALNTPGWGRPKTIARHRERAGWREVWTYAPKAGSARQLEFFNGRLVAISVQPDSSDTPQLISVSTQ